MIKSIAPNVSVSEPIMKHLRSDTIPYQSKREATMRYYWNGKERTKEEVEAITWLGFGDEIERR